MSTPRQARRGCERANCRAPASVRMRCPKDAALHLDACTYHARTYEAMGWTREEIPPRAAPLPSPPSDFVAGRRDALDAIDRRIASASAPIWTEATERGRGAAEAIRAVLAIVHEERARSAPVAASVPVPVPATTTGGPTP